MKKLHDLYFSPNIIRVVKSGMRWVGMWHVYGTEELHAEFWWGSVRAGDNLEDLGEDGRIIFKWTLKK
jgi:hypothetical protein